MKSRNELRLERRRKEYETPGTLQHAQAQRGPKPRAWMTENLSPEAFRQMMEAWMKGHKVSVHPPKPKKEQEGRFDP